MRKLLSAFAVAAFLALGPTGVAGQVQIGPTLALHDDFDFGIGASIAAQTPGIGEGFGFMGDFIVFFPEPDNLDYIEFNGNVTYSFPLAESTVLPFVLGGLNIARASIDDTLGDSVSDTDLGVNLGGGIAFDAGSFRPLVGGRFEVNGGDGFVVFATLPFEVGGG